MKSSLIVIFLVVLACSLVFVASVFAVGPGKVMEWNPAGSPGKVSIDGKVHADKGIKCMECHTKIWPMKKGTDMKMADMDAASTVASVIRVRKRSRRRTRPTVPSAINPRNKTAYYITR